MGMATPPQPRANCVSRRLATAILVALLVAGCGSGAANSTQGNSATQANASSHQLRMGFVMGDYSTNQLVLDEKNGAEAAAKALGISLNVQGSDSPQKQVSAIQDMTATKVDALIYGSADPKVTDPAISRAHAAGIPLVCTVSCGGEAAGASIDFNYRAGMGRPLGVWIASQLPATGGTVGIINTSLADPGVQQIYAGVRDGLNASHKAIKIDLSAPTNWDPATAATVSRDFLTAHPGLNVVVGLHDLVTAAAIQVMKTLHYPKVPVGGLGGTCQGLSNILAGAQNFTVLQNLYPIGYQGVALAQGLVKGTTQSGTHRTVPMFPMTKATMEQILAGNSLAKSYPYLVTSVKQAKSGCSS